MMVRNYAATSFCFSSILEDCKYAADRIEIFNKVYTVSMLLCIKSQCLGQCFNYMGCPVICCTGCKLHAISKLVECKVQRR